jgi:hypothetical protein
MKTLIVSALLAVSMVAATAGYTPKYRVTMSADKRTDFSRFKTYSWMDSHPAPVAATNARIVAAIERALRGRGLTKAARGAGDVVATYAALTRTDVQVKAKELSKDYRPEYAVGTLVVSLLDPAGLRTVLKLRADQPLAAGGLETQIDATVDAMFKRYPAPQRK